MLCRVSCRLQPPASRCPRTTPATCLRLRHEPVVARPRDLAAPGACTRRPPAACLHLAASEGNYPIVDFLIRAGANVNVEDRWGGTPLRDAVREGHRKVAGLMHSRGAQLGGEGDVSLTELKAKLDKALASLPKDVPQDPYVTT